METLFAKIDAEPARAEPARVVQSQSALPDWFELHTAHAGVCRRRRRARHSAAGRRHRDHDHEAPTAGYETASAPSRSAPASAPSRSSASRRRRASTDITKFLEPEQIVDRLRPGAGGIYKVRVGENTMSKDELAGVVKKLQAEQGRQLHRHDAVTGGKPMQALRMQRNVLLADRGCRAGGIVRRRPRAKNVQPRRLAECQRRQADRSARRRCAAAMAAAITAAAGKAAGSGGWRGPGIIVAVPPGGQFIDDGDIRTARRTAPQRRWRPRAERRAAHRRAPAGAR